MDTMSRPRKESQSALPLPVPLSSTPDSFRGRPRDAESQSRAVSTARLASPIPSHSQGNIGSPNIKQVPTPAQVNSSVSETPLAGAEYGSSLPGPGQSALADAFRSSFGQSPPRFGTPPLRPLSPHVAGEGIKSSNHQSNYGSFENRSIQGTSNWQGPSHLENPDIVKRHLVQASEASGDVSDDNGGSNRPMFGFSNDQGQSVAPGLDEDEFSSLQLQGGDMTREVYKWTEDMEAQNQGRGRAQRSKSFHISRPEPESDVLDISNIKIPGGFRRNYLRRAAGSPSPANEAHDNLSRITQGGVRPQPKMLTNNFIEFLSLYGHFAGEELEEDDEVLGPDEYFSSDPFGGSPRGFGDDEDDDRDPSESSALLNPGTPVKKRRKRKDRGGSGKNGTSGAVLLLLKSFVGTGVLFLPKAYLNGGMLFSNLVLLAVAGLSYYCFVLLVQTRLKVDGSFGDIGGILYGKSMRAVILFSVVLSQIGFASAYIVFTSENLQAFILAVSDCKTNIDIKFMILMQLIIFLPLSLIRDISKLGATALIADVFILLGLIYLYYYNIYTIAHYGVADIVKINSRDWTLFIGTAVFTFEGIGLIIPIQESMRNPTKFASVLGGVMIIITIIFVSMGALAYAAFGSHTKTVIILNLPQDNKFVNGVQFLYSLAILLSTPLQLFPAIRITENALFTRSGKYNPWIKWQKNGFRFLLVMLCSALAWGGAGDLDKFVALVGSFACVPLVYVYPPLLHLRAVARTRPQRILDISISIFGFVVMVYTTTLTIQSWASGQAPKSPGYCDRKGIRP